MARRAGRSVALALMTLVVATDCRLRDAGLVGHTCPCADATWVCETSRNECVRACDGGNHACNGACVAEGPSSCGPSCSTCTSPQNGTAACVAGACTAGECSTGYLRCGGTEGNKCCASAVAVTTGSSFTCALAAPGASGHVWCWGANDAKQLGFEGLGSSHPRIVAGLPNDVVAVAAGTTHACVLDRRGGVACWGDGTAGQLGGGDVEPKATATSIVVPGAPDTVFAALAASHDYTCGLTTTANVYCWGSLHADPADVVSRQPPTRVNLGGLKALDVSVGLGHACARLGGQIQCWGSNALGQLGDGTTLDSVSSPVAVVEINGARAFSIGRSHTCATVDDGAGGAVLCWGADDSFQLGNVAIAGVEPFHARPIRVTGVAGSKALAAGDGHTCGIFAGSSVACWGQNANGALGNESKNANVLALTVRDVAAVSVSAYAHTCVVSPENRIRCWGFNRSGQLGDLGGPNDFVRVPYEVLLR